MWLAKAINVFNRVIGGIVLLGCSLIGVIYFSEVRRSGWGKDDLGAVVAFLFVLAGGLALLTGRLGRVRVPVEAKRVDVRERVAGLMWAVRIGYIVFFLRGVALRNGWLGPGSVVVAAVLMELSLWRWRRRHG